MDRIDGNAGTDTAVYRGARNEYGLYLMDGYVTVDDSQASRDARDHVTTTEWLEFTDQSVAISSLTDGANHYCNSTINSTGVMATINVMGHCSRGLFPGAVGGEARPPLPASSSQERARSTAGQVTARGLRAERFLSLAAESALTHPAPHPGFDGVGETDG